MNDPQPGHGLRDPRWERVWRVRVTDGRRERLTEIQTVILMDGDIVEEIWTDGDDEGDDMRVVTREMHRG